MHPSAFQTAANAHLGGDFFVIARIRHFGQKGPSTVSKMPRTLEKQEKKVVRIWVFGGASGWDWLEGFFAYF